MAQTGYTPISIYYSATASNTPTAGNLVAGELAINTADGKLFYKDSSGVVQTIASKGTGSVAGSTTQVIYNNAGAYAGSANMTFNGTTLTLANDASISGLTVGKGGGALSFNTAIGANALAGTNTGSNQNTAVGYSALTTNTSGAYNSAFGLYSLLYNTTGSYNTAIGNNALQANTTSSYNTAVGYQAGYVCTGTQNTFIGQVAGAAATTGQNNTFVGQAAGYVVTTGSKNTIIGSYQGNSGGLDIRTASNYIVLSDGDGNPRLVGNNNGSFVAGKVVYGQVLTSGFEYNNTSGAQYLSVCTDAAGNTALWVANNGSSGTRQLVNFYAGGSGVGSITYNGTVTLYNTTSDERLKENVVDAGSGLDKLAKIKIRAFDWKANGMHTDFGVIAQEINQVAPELVSVGTDNEDGTIKNPWQVDTSTLVPAMIKAIQELKAEVDSLKAQLGK